MSLRRLRPRVVRVTAPVEVVLGGVMVATTTEALRVVEAGHAPAYYLPRSAFDPGSLRPAAGRSWCPWKGVAAYLDVVAGDTVASRAAWTYPRPGAKLAVLADLVGVDPDQVDRLTVDGEDVRSDG